MKQIHFPQSTRILRADKIVGGWKIWISTKDFVFGTYVLLYDNSKAERITERINEGPEILLICEEGYN